MLVQYVNHIDRIKKSGIRYVATGTAFDSQKFEKYLLTPESS